MSAPILSPAMLRELRAIGTTGDPSDSCEWGAANNLWFHSREKVLTALLSRDLITSEEGGFALTDHGRAAIAKGAA